MDPKANLTITQLDQNRVPIYLFIYGLLSLTHMAAHSSMRDLPIKPISPCTWRNRG